jgi:hypothetical protein
MEIAAYSASTRIQCESELTESKCKINERKWLEFAFISFYLLFLIWIFQRVTVDLNKKIRPFAVRATVVLKDILRGISPQPNEAR